MEDKVRGRFNLFGCQGGKFYCQHKACDGHKQCGDLHVQGHGHH